jgi:hypothetical protein
MSTDLNRAIHMEGVDEGVTLADLANLDMENVTEKRGAGPFPRGKFVFEVAEGKLDTFDGEIDGIKKKIPCAKLSLSVHSIIAVLDPEKDTEEGHKAIKERKFPLFIGIKKLEDTGRVKALMVDAGYKGVGKLQVLLDGFKGTRFIGEVKHKKNKDDPDNPYVNLDMDKIEPYKEETAA